jgi:hypothetical protein
MAYEEPLIIPFSDMKPNLAKIDQIEEVIPEPQPFVAKRAVVLLDRSGSTLEPHQARLNDIVLRNLERKLREAGEEGIPYAVYGFSSTFDSSPRLLLSEMKPFTEKHMAANLLDVHQAGGRQVVGGGTPTGEALGAVLGTLTAETIEDTSFLILTDGAPNDLKEAIRLAEHAHHLGANVTALVYSESVSRADPHVFTPQTISVDLPRYSDPGDIEATVDGIVNEALELNGIGQGIELDSPQPEISL